ncbi:DUF4041 domain-containing protein [Salinibacterium sp. SWN248]|uniref:DUF4041 domain-containing protein n=1 Tax=Salinibacterium sp. SWN248 TaxID=2792056 RepID=UPI001E45F871|nr:DUF4041 domain-containing protein [Salinibacterium sp. SWN248]
MTVPAGWYPAHDGSVRMQWWDGTAWRDEFAEPQGADLKRFQTAAAAPRVETAPALHQAEQVQQTSETKINVFNALKTAKKLQDENQRLSKLVADHGLLEVAEIDALKVAIQNKIFGAEERLRGVEVELLARENEVAAAKALVLDVRAAHDLQELGLFDFEHPAENSVSLNTELVALRSEIKSMVQQRTAVTATTSFTFNNSASKGKKFVKDMSSILLRAYNAESENAIKTVRAGNLKVAQERLSKVKEQIARQGTMIDLRVSELFHSLRLKELELASRHLQALQAEKEAERSRRAELAEQRKAEAELKREQERLDKQKSHYLTTIAALESKGDLEGVERMRALLADVEKAIEDVDYRAANIRAGYVYVISNVGAFGEHMVKIGMTRRLEPMDRVNELGDASVPFKFDVHALFFANDAIDIEAMLHREFAEQRVNKVNLRREFFRVKPSAVLDVLKEHNVEVLEFKETADAPEFRMSSRD